MDIDQLLAFEHEQPSRFNRIMESAAKDRVASLAIEGIHVETAGMQRDIIAALRSLARTNDAIATAKEMQRIKQ